MYTTWGSTEIAEVQPNISEIRCYVKPGERARYGVAIDIDRSVSKRVAMLGFSVKRASSLLAPCVNVLKL